MTDRFAIFGRPVAHSKSPPIYQAFAAQFGIDLDYRKIEPTADFLSALEAFRKSGARGGNVTAPFKLDAFAAATKRTPRAEMAGAVNCFQFVGDDIIAENFDGLGLVADIERNLGFPLAGKTVLMLGAGGAVRGALLPFLEARPARLVLANRTVSKAEDLAARFAAYGRIEPVGYDGIGEASFDTVVNATSASLSGDCPPLPRSAFQATGLAYELVYGKGLTPFLALGQQCGARLADGVGMLVEQAAEAFNWWYGHRPDTAATIRALTVPITHK